MTARHCFRTGDRVVVRSPAEILATLDMDGTLDGLPFMAEMLESCGRPFRIHRPFDVPDWYVFAHVLFNLIEANLGG